MVRINAESETVDSPPVVSSVFSLEAHHSSVMTLTGLIPNSRYAYVVIRQSEDGYVDCTPLHKFQTQRVPGSSYNFAIFADSHLGTIHHCNVSRYKQTLENIHYQNPDFVLSLGDDFRASLLKKPVTFEAVEQLYRAQRPYFSIFGQDAPLFNVVGNHELQSGWLLDGTEHNIPIWAIKSRLSHYPNPRPNHFYSGASAMNEFIPLGLLENHYAWTWGDALFITLDNYFFSNEELGWGVSLGFDQFNWMIAVVQKDVGLKFLFHHHLCGSARGGIEWASYYEWGGYSPVKGKNSRKTWDFDSMRPGWGNKSIHQILVENKVDVVFQGHDHLYTMQEHPDGVVYVTVPMPAYNPDAFWGGPNDNSMAFKSGVVRAPSGHISVDVTGRTATVSYVLSRIAGDNPANGANGQVGHTFRILK